MAWVALALRLSVPCVLGYGSATLTVGSSPLSEVQIANRIPLWFESVLAGTSHFGRPAMVVVESQGQVPRMGHLMRAVMVSVLSTATSHGIATKAVHPSTWKSRCGLVVGGKQTRATKKNASLEMARKSWPQCPSHDFADAYLLGCTSIESNRSM